MDLRGFDKNAKIILAAGIDWWNSMSIELLSEKDIPEEQRTKLEQELELGLTLYLELTGYQWHTSCPYLEHLGITDEERRRL